MTRWQDAPLAEEAAPAWMGAPIDDSYTQAAAVSVENTPQFIGEFEAKFDDNGRRIKQTPYEAALDRSHIGRILDAFGQGARDGWGDRPLGIGPETDKWLRDAGLFRNGQSRWGDVFRTFNEAIIRPAAAGLDASWRSLTAGINAASVGAAVAGGEAADASGLSKAVGMSGESLSRDLLIWLNAAGAVGGLRVSPRQAAGIPRGRPVEAAPVSTEGRPVAPMAMTDDSLKPVSISAPVEPNETFASKSAHMDKAGNIRLDNINRPEDWKQLFRDVAKENSDFVGVRGEPPDGVVSIMAQQEAADALGLTPENFNKNSRPADVPWSVWTRAVKDAAIKSGDDVREKMLRAASGTDEDVMAYAEARARHMALQEEFSRVTAEGGRTLAALKRSDALAEAKNLGEFLKGSTGKTLDELRAEAKAGLELDTPAKLGKFLNDSRRATFTDMFYEYWIQGLLSGPRTHLRNIASNTMTALWDIPETAVTAAIGKARQIAGSTDERVMFGEVGAEIVGMVEAAPGAVRAAARAFKEESGTGGMKVELERPRAIPSAKVTIAGREIEIGGKQVRVFGRAMTAEDEFFKAIATRQELQKMAYRQASKEGLRGDAHTARRVDLVENPTDEMMAKASEAAHYRTFTNPLGPFGSAIARIPAANKHARLALTFIKTPLNIAKYTLLDRTPLGLLSKELRETLSGKQGAIARDTAIARMVLGTTVMLAGFKLAAEALITGAGPKDPKERAALYLTGWQPYSIRIGDGYYTYASLEPLATILGLAADIHEAASRVDADTDEAQIEQVAAAAVGAVVKNTLSKTSMMGLADAMEAAQDTDTKGVQWVNKFAGTLVPNIVAQAAQAQDPYLREVRDWHDAVMNRVPGLKAELLPRRDVWGEPIELTGGVAALSPIFVSRMEKDPVNRELLAVRYFPGKVDRKIGGVTLTPEQYDELAMVSGRLAKMALNETIGAEGWDSVPAEARRETIAAIIAEARAQGRDLIRMKYPEILERVAPSRLR